MDAPNTESTPGTALAPADTLLIDGERWLVQSITGRTVRTAHATTGKFCACDLHDVVPLAPGLFGLTGRIEAPKRTEASATLSVATADAVPQA